MGPSRSGKSRDLNKVSADSGTLPHKSDTSVVQYGSEIRPEHPLRPGSQPAPHRLADSPLPCKPDSVSRVGPLADIGWQSFLFRPRYLGRILPKQDATITRGYCGRVTLPLFCLAPRGVCHASLVTLGAVGSYPTFSPLLLAEARSGIFSAALSVQPSFRRTGPRFHKARHPVVSGLSSRLLSKQKPRDYPGSGPIP